MPREQKLLGAFYMISEWVLFKNEFILFFSHTWSDILKKKGDTQAVYRKFDMKIILMPLWKEKEAWTVNIARSLAMLQKNTHALEVQTSSSGCIWIVC